MYAYNVQSISNIRYFQAHNIDKIFEVVKNSMFSISAKNQNGMMMYVGTSSRLGAEGH